MTGFSLAALDWDPPPKPD